jgi:hypothetical protein
VSRLLTKDHLMNAEEAHHDRLIEIAAKAYQHSVAINLAQACRNISSPDKPTLEEIAEIDSAKAASVAADKALVDWRARTSSH